VGELVALPKPALALVPLVSLQSFSLDFVSRMTGSQTNANRATWGYVIQLAAGTRVRVTAFVGSGWALVQLPDGRSAYLRIAELAST
jgi:hypothetical protein